MASPFIPLVLIGGAVLYIVSSGKRRSKGGGVPVLQPELQNECDPLDPSTWGPGCVCVPWEGRWVLVPEARKPPGGSQAATGWPCPRPYRGYCIEVWDALDGVVAATAPSTAWRWRVLTTDGKEIERGKGLSLYGYSTAWEALEAAYTYVDDVLDKN